MATTTSTTTTTLTPGMYRVDDTFYKVQTSQTGNLYAKRLVLNPNNDGAYFEYAPGVVRSLTVWDRLTLDEAKRFGALYGTCVVCGRLLSDPKSVAAGIGPVCAKRV